MSLDIPYLVVIVPESDPARGIAFWTYVDRGKETLCSAPCTNFTPAYCTWHSYAFAGQVCPGCETDRTWKSQPRKRKAAA